MKKRLISLLLVLVMAVALVPAVFAETNGSLTSKLNELQDQVNVPAKMQVRKDGASSWATTLTLEKSEMTQPYDYVTTLTTSPIKNAIIEWYTAAKSVIATLAGNNAALKDRLETYFEEWNVTGEFTVTIRFPAQFTGAELDKHLDPNTTASDNMFGFNEEAKNLFVETSRTVTTDGDFKVLTIKIAIKDLYPAGSTKQGVPEQMLYDGVMDGTYLNELTYTVEDVIPGTFTSSLTTYGKMEGFTTIQIGPSADDSDRVYFFTNNHVDVSATLKKVTAGGGGGGSVDDDVEYKISFNIDGRTDEIAPIYTKGTYKANKLPYPSKPGYTFKGWYWDSGLTDKVEGTLKINKDVVLYGHWVSNTLTTDEHYAYIIGYPDETVRPERNITREEATMIFYRLLRDEVRDSIFTLENNFSDILTERWSNSAISTMANGGYVTGRPGGEFDPEASITRAEFATLAVRFGSLMDTDGVSFTDISGHWAEQYILKAAKAGWIKGYPDGSFHPDAKITRAEAMTLVNNVLMRHVNAEGLHADTRIWIDMKGDEWFYYIVLEATNSHDFTRQADGYNETWTAMLPNKTWK